MGPVLDGGLEDKTVREAPLDLLESQSPVLGIRVGLNDTPQGISAQSRTLELDPTVRFETKQDALSPLTRYAVQQHPSASVSCASV